MQLFMCQNISISLRVVSLSVPALRARGEAASLACEYDLAGGRLYSVKWYRDNEEFYRYMPRLRPPQHAHALDGVTVDLHKSSARRVHLRDLTLKSRGLYRCELHKSSARRVHLRDLTLKSRGLYRCEVSEEAPSFHSAEAEAFLEVYCAPLFKLTHEEEEEERREVIEGQAHAQGRDPPTQQPQQRRADRALHAGRGARASLVAQLRRR
ncbi:unnamed protein product [Plutella xylostella]|uniref:(diamondback moth) hypothetical protein n=1 Tax=Plutella xylostella TaxID=51655 RepID=A0A8S4F7G5_PLUXY|nr:unnamed protein product [Plutella xylostella]